MSTKEKQKRGSGAAAVVIILCAAALAAPGLGGVPAAVPHRAGDGGDVCGIGDGGRAVL